MTLSLAPLPAPTRTSGRRLCLCGCARRVTHTVTDAAGVSLMDGCEFAARLALRVWRAERECAG